jgi:putative oxidoreductase
MKILSPKPFLQQEILAILRIVLGVFMIIHGKEVFEPSSMKDYTTWDAFKQAPILPYLGKGAELVAGVLLVPGLFTRIAALIAMGTFAYIVFFVGEGKYWMNDQHPFLFVLFGVLFFFAGPGKWSLDAVLFKK